MLVITLDIDQREVSREEHPNDYRPLNGFEKRSDGNYYKQLGDPRNITDEERKREILEKQRQIQLSNSKSQSSGLSPKDTTKSVSKQLDHEDDGKTKDIQAECKTTLKALEEWTKDAYIHHRGPITTFYGPVMLGNCGLKALERRSFFAIIELNFINKTISIWDTNPDRPRPNTILRDALE